MVLSAQELRAVDLARQQTDAALTAQNLEPPHVPFASNEAFVAYIIDYSMMPSWIKSEAAHSAEVLNLDDRWAVATPVERTQTVEALPPDPTGSRPKTT
jgi:hypothetical protein